MAFSDDMMRAPLKSLILLFDNIFCSAEREAVLHWMAMASLAIVAFVCFPMTLSFYATLDSAPFPQESPTTAELESKPHQKNINIESWVLSCYTSLR